METSTLVAAERIALPDRNAHFRSAISPTSRVLEIGPSHAPLAPKADGFDVAIVDHASQEDLRRKYVGHGVQLERIEPVDYVWTGGSLLDLVEPERHGSFDICFASHVIEHLPDPIMFLNSAASLLKPGGTLMLAVPDKRFCCDLFRPISTTASWLNAARSGGRIHDRTTAFDHTAYVVAEKRVVGWVRTLLVDLAFADFGLERAYSLYDEIGDPRRGDYRDYHAWTFTPSSFLLMIYELHALGAIKFLPDRCLNLEGSEFLVNLRVGERAPITAAERLEYLKSSGREQAIGFNMIP